MNVEKTDEGPIRLQLAIARAGLASRRHAEAMIAAGRVRVNGETVTEMGTRVNPAKDAIEIDGRPLPRQARNRVTIALNKPVGWLSAASDGHGGRVVTDLVRDIPARLVPVGRLDKDSSGLLLMSDDGDLIAEITHPRGGHAKTYLVEVSGRCDEETLATLRGAMTIDGYLLRPVEVRQVREAGTHAVLEFVLHEGRNRQIRKMCANAGLNVVRLTRTAVGPITLDGLKPGEYRILSPDEIAALRGKGTAARPKAADYHSVDKTQRPKMAAVSVRRTRSPRETSFAPAERKAPYSRGEKSPSGPTAHATAAGAGRDRRDARASRKGTASGTRPPAKISAPSAARAAKAASRPHGRDISGR